MDMFITAVVWFLPTIMLMNKFVTYAEKNPVPLGASIIFMLVSLMPLLNWMLLGFISVGGD